MDEEKNAGKQEFNFEKVSQQGLSNLYFSVQVYVFVSFEKLWLDWWEMLPEKVVL